MRHLSEASIGLCLALLAPLSSGQEWVSRAGRLHFSHAIQRIGSLGLPARVELRPSMRMEVSEWDGQAWETTSRFPTLPSPSSVRLAIDEARGEQLAVLFTDVTMGTRATYVRVADTWVPRAGAPPHAVADIGLVYHPALRSLVSLGWGNGPDFVWDGASWQSLPPSPRPSLISFCADPQRGVVVGVTDNTAGFIEVWESDGIRWQLRPTPVAPVARDFGASIAWEPRSQRVMLFGPDLGRRLPLLDTWFWDGIAWSQAATNAPDVSASATLAFDQSLGSLRLFENGHARDWAWDGANWVAQPLSGPSGSFYMAVDALRGRLVQLDQRDTWEWDGMSWSQTPAFSGSLQGARVVFDISTPGLLLYSTGPDPVFGQISHTSTYDGVAWTQRSGQMPPPRFSYALISAPISGGVLLFGGHPLQGQVLRDTWLWNGSWTDLTPTLSVSPSPFGLVSSSDPHVSHDPLLVSGRELWKWTGSWQLVDAAVPASPVALTMTAAGNPFVIAARVAHELRSGQWVPLPGVAYGDEGLVRDPLRGTLMTFLLGEPFVLTDRPAREVAYGVGCGTPEPRLSGVGFARIASPEYRIDLTAPAGAPTLLALSGSNSILPLGAGCTQWIGAPTAVWFAIASANGRASFPLAIPNAPALRGQDAFVQGAVLQPGGPLGGLAFSAALRLEVGD